MLFLNYNKYKKDLKKDNAVGRQSVIDKNPVFWDYVKKEINDFNSKICSWICSVFIPPFRHLSVITVSQFFILIPLSNISFNRAFGFIGFGRLNINTSSTSSAAFNIVESNTLETITITNNTTQSLSVKSYVAPRYSNLALFWWLIEF